MKNKGMTIIESVVTIALLGLIFLLIAPLINSFGKVNNRVKTQKEIDAEFSVVNEFIQKKIRSAKTTGTSSNELGRYVGVYSLFDKDDFFDNGVADNNEGNVLFLEIPDDDGNPEFTFFILEDNKLKYREGINGTNEILMGNIDSSLPDDDEDTKRAKSNFRLHQGIVVYHIKLDLTSYTYGDENYEGKIKGTLRGSASTRIDINFE